MQRYILSSIIPVLVSYDPSEIILCWFVENTTHVDRRADGLSELKTTCSSDKTELMRTSVSSFCGLTTKEKLVVHECPNPTQNQNQTRQMCRDPNTTPRTCIKAYRSDRTLTQTQHDCSGLFIWHRLWDDLLEESTSPQWISFAMYHAQLLNDILRWLSFDLTGIPPHISSLILLSEW